MSFIAAPGGVQSTLPQGCRTPTPPAMLDGLFPYMADMNQADGSKTPTDAVMFANMGHLREKLLKLQALQQKVAEDKMGAAPLYVQVGGRLAFAQVEEPARPSPFESGVIQLPPPGLSQPQVDAGICQMPPPGLGEPQADAGVLPPPQPHQIPRPLKDAKAASQPAAAGHVVSLGSVGHPFSCAGACKYVKRKGGCRDGAQCTKCHSCFWSRVPAGAEEQEDPTPAPAQETLHVQESQPFSVGSIGHPYTCQNACKHVWRKSGCRDGANCPNCHYCKWQRKSKEEEPQESTQAGPSSTEPIMMNIAPPPGLELPTSPSPLDAELQSPERISSLGSLGHPYSCAQACKYVGKAKGCRDGPNCPNCHLCRWSRWSGSSGLKVIHL